MKDNLEQIKTNAKFLLNVEPKQMDHIPFLISHPYISHSPEYYSDNGELKTFDPLTDQEELKNYKKYMLKQIESKNNFLSIAYLINKPFRLFFFEMCSSLLNEEDYSIALKDLWISSEFPNYMDSANFLKKFNIANRKYLMTEEENKYYNSLPNVVTIYCGIDVSKNIKALSWTNNYDMAFWFATRFSSEGYVFETKVNKENIIAYFNQRGEDELIIDFTKIKDVKCEKVLKKEHEFDLEM